MPEPAELSPKDAHTLLSQDPSTTYVDVRSSQEFAGGHVPGSINVPLAQIDAFGRMIPNPEFGSVMGLLFRKDQRLIVGCASGGRSRQACQILAADGFTAVTNMAGGFQGGRGPFGIVPGWAQCGLPVATDGTTWDQARAKASPAS